MTQPTGNHYTINKLDDLMQLDPRQLDAFIKDLKTWYAFRKHIGTKIEETKETMRAMGLADDVIEDAIQVLAQDGITWIDDGKDGGVVNASLSSDDGIEHASATLNIDGEGNVTSIKATQ